MTGNRSTNGGTTGLTPPASCDHRTEAGLPLALALAHREAGHVLKARVLVAQADDRADQGDLVHEPAIWGSNSLIWTPGSRVAIGLNSPRIPSGASGFRSKVS